MSGRFTRGVTLAAGAALFFALLSEGNLGSAQGRRPVDLELVLAVDTSSSVSPGEFDLQMRGIASAFRDPAVQAAIQAAGDLGIAVAMVQWSDNRKQTLAIHWKMVRDPVSAEAFANEIDGTPRYLIGGGTAIGGAVNFAAHQLRINRYNGRRMVIDVSGDGRTNQGSNPARARDDAVAQGITINGLAILCRQADCGGRPVTYSVEVAFERDIIGGPGSFVVTADGRDSFAEAVRQKLVLEIASPAPSCGHSASEPLVRPCIRRAIRSRTSLGVIGFSR